MTVLNQKPNGTKMLQVVETLPTGENKIYNSVFVEPENIDILSNDLAMKIITALSRSKGCAMDISRELKQHEQKIYYHIRRLEEAGIIKKVGIERRFGMTAKMYSTVSPIVSAKLYEDGHVLSSVPGDRNPQIIKLLSPFVENGRLNAKIVVGDTFPHGKYDGEGKEGAHVFDFILMLGNFVKDVKYPIHRLDTEITEDELKNNNLILIGNVKTNTVIEKINDSLPVFFDVGEGWHIQSKLTGIAYDDARTGVIIKLPSLFNPEKMILILGGPRTRGTQAAVIAFTRHQEKLAMLEKDNNIVSIVTAVDKDSDKILDDVKFLEPVDV